MATVNALVACSLALFCSLAGAAERTVEPPPGHALTRTDLESWLDGFMPYALDTGDVAGAVVAVVSHGETLLVKGYGYSDAAARAPVDPDRTLFRPGSTSKLFTWTAVMQLVEQGKLDLDRDVNDYLDFRLPVHEGTPITLRNIMTHTAGFEEQIKQLILDDPRQLPSLKDYVEHAPPTRIFSAGTTPAYSNYATAMAGYIVQRVSGQPFDDYIETHIFQPLGMQHASFRQPLPAALAPDAAKGYERASEPPKPYEIVTPAPAGSLAASGADMAHFMIAHLEGGAYQGARILAPQTLKLMHETPLTMIPPLNRMMLGFYEQNYNGHRVISHGGDTEYFHSDLSLFPDDDVGLFFSMNSAGRDAAAHTIRSGLFERFADRYFPGAPDTRRTDLKTALADGKALAGYYDNSRRVETSFLSIANLIQPIRVAAATDGTVSMSMFQGINGATRHYHEVQPFVWVDPDTGWRLAAKLTDGHVARFSVDEISPFMVFEPIPWWRSPGWLRPAAAASLAACLLTALLWPVAALVRRRYHVGLGLAGRSARAHRLSRIACVLISLATLGWATVIAVGLSDLILLGPGLDPALFALHALSVLAYLGGAAALLWAASVTWAEHSAWTRRVWTTTLALGAVALLWTATVYHLMSFRTTY
ncbi:MAG TPA: serine hydrolase domain-containing protein [Steroidobacteraceae bacterium]|nr:serine hydrolase domain-containing protein [Steroidobacteraceae bacterium]